VVARVEGPGDQDLALRQVLAAQALAARDAPVARLFRPEIQPLLVGNRAVTLWRRVRSVATPTLSAIGRAVRTIHEATVGSLPKGVPTIDPFGEVRACLDSPSPWSGSAAIAELGRRADELASRWEEGTQDDPLGLVVVHGDPYADNAIVSEGGLVLVDLEDAGVGPASWDFAPIGVGVERYGVPTEDFQQFAAGYGAEPGPWPGYSLMCRVYELMVTAWAVRCTADSPGVAGEAAVRVAGLLEGDPTRWTRI
jgi:Ser/Thr protein kinase RdoA (MazF antagonist)